MRVSQILDYVDSGQMALANRAGFRCFTTAQDFKAYVQKEILADENGLAAVIQSVDS